MDKRYLHHLWTRARIVRPWYFLIVSLLALTLGVYGLRANNLHMAALRQAVYDADKNNGNVQKALQDLQVYVTGHMNTDLSNGPNAPYPPIQLVYTYDRAVQAAGEQAKDFNAQIYTAAQQYCIRQNPTARFVIYLVPCVQQYVHDHGVTNAPVIPDSLYKFDFVSPVWSPDLAGWSLFIAVISFLAFVDFLFVYWWIQRSVK